MKNKIVNKIKSRKGETYIEVLFAVLVIAFATLIVAVLYSTAFNLNVSAREKDDAFYTALQQVERLETENRLSGDVTITSTDDDGKITSNTVNVDAYESGGITAYRAQNSTGG